MKQWTIEELEKLWIGRGYSERAARAMAAKDYKEMNEEKTPETIHETMQAAQYN